MAKLGTRAAHADALKPESEEIEIAVNTHFGIGSVQIVLFERDSPGAAKSSA